MAPSFPERFFEWKNLSSWAPLLAFLQGRRPGWRIVGDALAASYQGVIAYHGCRPEDVKAYYRNGLLPSSSGELDARAKEIFCGNDGVTVETIDAITSKLGHRDHGRVYAALDDRHLLAHANHYLIYGSERLQCVAAALTDTIPDCMRYLKRYGVPTIFRVALPWEVLPETDYAALARETTRSVANARWNRAIPESWVAFEFSKPLDSRYVLSHEHPSVLADMHDGMKPYVYQPGAAT